MADEIRERLRSEIQSVAWDALEPFFKQGTLITLGPGMDLIEVAAKMAEDDRVQVEAWLHSGRLGRPNDEAVTRWRGEPETTFAFVIVQPYVVAQEMIQ